MQTKLFSLAKTDFVKGAVMAIVAGVVFPLAAMIQSPDFNVLNLDWGVFFGLAANGAFTSFVSYIVTKFFSDENGKVLGMLG